MVSWSKVWVSLVGEHGEEGSGESTSENDDSFIHFFGGDILGNYIKKKRYEVMGEWGVESDVFS